MTLEVPNISSNYDIIERDITYKHLMILYQIMYECIRLCHLLCINCNAPTKEYDRIEEVIFNG